jgi:hypothetical protein
LKSKFKSYIGIIAGLAAGSGLFYGLNYLLFPQRFQELNFLLLEDLIFLPISVILVTLLLDMLMRRRSMREKLEQMGIIINAFFTEAGAEILSNLNCFVPEIIDMREHLHIQVNWTAKEFKDAEKYIQTHPIHADARNGDLKYMHDVLLQKKQYILVLFENPNLIEHSSVTDMLWSLYHLIDEFASRDSFDNLPESDLKHLSVDITRAYKQLMLQWLTFMRQLKERYPYLFSMAVRKSPYWNTGAVIPDMKEDDTSQGGT